MIKIVREPSDTPNIQNTDDFVGLRYSYGDYNGYVNNKGQMLAYQINGSTFKVLSGRAVVNGVEVDIDANGASITIDNISQTQDHSLYIRVNLATMKADLFDVIGNDLPTSDDLTANTAGMAYLLLYTFNSTAGVISDVVKKVEKITSLKDVISGVVLVEKAKHAEKSVDAEQTDFTNTEWHEGLDDLPISPDDPNTYEIEFQIIHPYDSEVGSIASITAFINFQHAFKNTNWAPGIITTIHVGLGAVIYSRSSTEFEDYAIAVAQIDIRGKNGVYKVTPKLIVNQFGSTKVTTHQPNGAWDGITCYWRRIR